ncbi:MAG TPA: hypothetical protein VN300_06395, partial [Desulfobacterales bacterium]|nr:hypothetical protein [Desulfobacterales bacterium]
PVDPISTVPMVRAIQAKPTDRFLMAAVVRKKMPATEPASSLFSSTKAFKLSSQPAFSVA